MGWQQFVVDLVRALAWPLVVAVSAWWFFRGQIGGLIERIKSIGNDKFRIDFTRRAKDIESDAVEAVAAAQLQSAPASDREVLVALRNARHLAPSDPLEAVVTAHQVLADLTAEVLGLWGEWSTKGEAVHLVSNSGWGEEPSAIVTSLHQVMNLGQEVRSGREQATAAGAVSFVDAAMALAPVLLRHRRAA